MAFEVGLTLVDDYARTTTRRFTNTATLVADALTQVGAFITLLLAVSDAGTVKHEITTRTVASNAADSGANKDVGGTIHCRLDNGKVYPLHIPCIKAAMLNPDGTIDIADAAITAYVDEFMTGGHFTVSEGNLIDEILYGELDG